MHHAAGHCGMWPGRIQYCTINRPLCFPVGCAHRNWSNCIYRSPILSLALRSSNCLTDGKEASWTEVPHTLTHVNYQNDEVPHSAQEHITVHMRKRPELEKFKIGPPIWADRAERSHHAERFFCLYGLERFDCVLAAHYPCRTFELCIILQNGSNRPSDRFDRLGVKVIVVHCHLLLLWA